MNISKFYFFLISIGFISFLILQQLASAAGFLNFLVKSYFNSIFIVYLILADCLPNISRRLRNNLFKQKFIKCFRWRHFPQFVIPIEGLILLKWPIYLFMEDFIFVGLIFTTTRLLLFMELYSKTWSILHRVWKTVVVVETDIRSFTRLFGKSASS